MRPSTALVRAVVLGGSALVLAAMAATSAACGAADPQAQASPVNHLYVNNKFHFSLLVDSRFESILPGSLPGSALKVNLTDKDGSAKGVTPDGMSITLIDKKPNAGRNAAESDRLLKKLVAQLENAGATPGKPWLTTTVGGLPAAWNEDVDTSNGYSRISYLVVGHRNVYLMAGESTQKTWDASRPEFVAAFESFREL